MSQSSDNNKRIAKNTLLLYVRMLFMMAVSLYTSRVILNTLGVQDFGLYNVVAGFVTMFTFINSAMASATQRYLNFELGKNNEDRLLKVFSTSVNIHAVISLIVLLLAETIGLWFVYTQLTIPEGRIDAVLWVYQCAIISTCVLVMSVPYNAAIIAHEKMGAFAYISVAEVTLKLLIVYLLTIGNFDKLKLYAVLMLAVQVLVMSIYRRYSVKHFKETKYHWVWDKALFKEMTGFAGWSLFGNLAAVAFTQGVNVLLNIFFGPVVNAARGVTVQVQNAIMNFCRNFQMALNPQIVKLYASNELDPMHRLIYRSTKFSFFLLLLLSLPVMIEADYILRLWLKIVPDHTVAFVRIVLCISLVDAIGNPLITAAQANGHIKKYQAVVGGILLGIVPISYVVLKLGAPPVSVFIVHFVMVVLAHVSRVWMIRPMISMRVGEYVVKAILPLLYVSVPAILISVAAFRSIPTGFLGFIAVCLVCALSVSTFTYWLGFDLHEREFVKSKVVAILNKIRK